jgi:hypothetical protein
MRSTARRMAFVRVGQRPHDERHTCDSRMSMLPHTTHGSHGTSALVSLRGSVAQPLTRTELEAKWTIGSETWAWKSFKSTAEFVYRLLRAPHEVPDFVDFIQLGSAALKKVPPLNARFDAIHNEPIYRPSWHQVISFARKQRDTLDVPAMVILGELVALFCITRRDANVLTLIAYVAMSQKSLDTVVTLTETEIRVLSVHSDITPRVLKNPNPDIPAWLPEDIRSGEGIKSVDHYFHELSKRPVSVPVREPIREPIAVEQSAPRARSPQQRSTSTPIKPKPRVEKKVDTNDVCSRCLQRGHRFNKCAFAAHKEYNNAAPFELINRLARGEVAVANEGLKN